MSWLVAALADCTASWRVRLAKNSSAAKRPSLKTCSSAEPPTLPMVWKALVNRFSIWLAASVAVET